MNKKQKKRKQAQARAHQQQETSQPTSVIERPGKVEVSFPTPPRRKRKPPPGWPYHFHRGFLMNGTSPIMHEDQIWPPRNSKPKKEIVQP